MEVTVDKANIDTNNDQLVEYIEGQIWLHEYPIRYAGIDLFGRMTIIKLNNGELIIHDPCKIDKILKQKIDSLGTVKYIVAPGNFHHLYVTDFQLEYPKAETFICPGLERKRTDIKYDWILGNRSDQRWSDTLDHILIQGTKIIWEVAFFHKPSKTLILVDIVENIGDDYQHPVSLLLRFWWKFIFRMWNNPKAAPEYQMGWGDKKIVRHSLQQIIDWNPKRVILSHGELIEEDVQNILTTAWKKIL